MRQHNSSFQVEMMNHVNILVDLGFKTLLRAVFFDVCRKQEMHICDMSVIYLKISSGCLFSQ